MLAYPAQAGDKDAIQKLSDYLNLGGALQFCKY